MQCQICKLNPSKYKCPGCGVRTCSVTCVKQHKVNTGCSGQVSHTEYVPLHEMNEQTLGRDYTFLEEQLRVLEQASRLEKPLLKMNQFQVKHAEKQMDSPDDHLPPFFPSANSSAPSNQPKLPPMTERFRLLYNSCSSRNINLCLMPDIFARHKQNRSYYNTKSKTIFWSLDFRYSGHQSGHILDDFCETELISSALTRESLATYCRELSNDADFDISSASFVYLLSIPFQPASSPAFNLIDPTLPLSESLRGVDILEFPTIYIEPAPQTILPSEKEQNLFLNGRHYTIKPRTIPKETSIVASIQPQKRTSSSKPGGKPKQRKQLSEKEQIERLPQFFMITLFF
ncbi:putative box C/D snoRNA protein 1 [Blattamonas nauphoetae]|uniref:Box C/D snoRNA protein 1 n=1 Tax=Blattamonas nauphoetae TaxID=2049346 RepID=A0ABQ9X446_9EUKA|nr:putative box C/D snoRNA protein 1 [Blattamonas nauphoetae]